MCCSPWGLKESDTTERLNHHHQNGCTEYLEKFAFEKMMMAEYSIEQPVVDYILLVKQHGVSLHKWHCFLGIGEVPLSPPCFESNTW